MLYTSTRDNRIRITASQAILQGLSEDGGLYVPVDFPRINRTWQEVKNYTYQEMAEWVLGLFLTDFSAESIKACVQAAYGENFDDERMAPLVQVGDHYHLELFHGQTIAFKDMALSILPHLMKKAAKMNHNTNESVILTATSGDTGKAAMAGFKDVIGTKIIVFYPKGGVSSIQERQMITQEGENTYVIAVEGNFDDAQNQVKKLFNDVSLREKLAQEGCQFSSANSMNIGRLLPQIVYYFYAYAQLLKEGQIKEGEKINFTVPTGNFGNILAAYYAKKMGLPVDKLVCASNDNTVLYDLFQTGTYDRCRPFKLTISPSMDILISSNFERLLYYAVGENSEEVKEYMDALNLKGSYHLSDEVRKQLSDFVGEYASEEETLKEIGTVYTKEGYLMDPHTAVASVCGHKAKKGLKGKNIIVSTASPYKFPEAILKALAVENPETDRERLEFIHQKSGIAFPPTITTLFQAPVRHRMEATVEEMKDYVLAIIHQKKK